MKNLLKKNQVMITALAIMIAVAGYLNFAGGKLNEEELLEVNSGTVSTEGTVLGGAATSNINEEDYDLASALEISDEEQLDLADIKSLDYDLEDSVDSVDSGAVTNTTGETASLPTENAAQGDIPGEAVFTSTTSVSSLSGAKLMKEQTRAKNKETLLDIINSTTLGEEQKQTAINGMISLTDIAEKETACEILLEAKGFGDVVVSISADMVDVVVNAPELTEQQRAQIEDIVKRKTGIVAENIIISPVTGK